MSNKPISTPRPLQVRFFDGDGDPVNPCYEITDTPENILRSGLTRPGSTRTGMRPVGTVHLTGLVTVSIEAEKAIARDDRFRLALAHVLNGRVPCVDFSLPPVPKRGRRPDTGEAA